MVVVSRLLVLMFFLLIISIPKFINASYLFDACTKAEASSPTIHRDFCVGALQADTKSGAVNFASLAQIAAELTSKNATSMKAKIKDLLAKPENEENNIRDVLLTCLDLYTGMVDYLSDAISAISSSRYDDAQTYLSTAVDTPGDCEDTFSEGGTKSILAKEDADVRQLSAIALAFLNM